MKIPKLPFFRTTSNPALPVADDATAVLDGRKLRVAPAAVPVAMPLIQPLAVADAGRQRDHRLAQAAVGEPIGGLAGTAALQLQDFKLLWSQGATPLKLNEYALPAIEAHQQLAAGQSASSNEAAMQGLAGMKAIARIMNFEIYTMAVDKLPNWQLAGLFTTLKALRENLPADSAELYYAANSPSAFNLVKREIDARLQGRGQVFKEALISGNKRLLEGLKNRDNSVIVQALAAIIQEQSQLARFRGSFCGVVKLGGDDLDQWSQGVAGQACLALTAAEKLQIEAYWLSPECQAMLGFFNSDLAMIPRYDNFDDVFTEMRTKALACLELLGKKLGLNLPTERPAVAVAFDLKTAAALARHFQVVPVAGKVPLAAIPDDPLWLSRLCDAASIACALRSFELPDNTDSSSGPYPLHPQLSTDVGRSRIYLNGERLSGDDVTCQLREFVGDDDFAELLSRHIHQSAFAFFFGHLRDNPLTMRPVVVQASLGTAGVICGFTEAQGSGRTVFHLTRTSTGVMIDGQHQANLAALTRAEGQPLFVNPALSYLSMGFTLHLQPNGLTHNEPGAWIRASLVPEPMPGNAAEPQLYYLG